jgi:hypothetical protein
METMVRQKKLEIQNCIKIFKEFWGENGDQISRQYAGTGET